MGRAPSARRHMGGREHEAVQGGPPSRRNSAWPWSVHREKSTWAVQVSGDLMGCERLMN